MKKKETAVNLTPVDVKTFLIPIEGMTSLLMHKFSDRSIQQIEDKQDKKSRMKKKRLAVDIQGWHKVSQCFYHEKCWNRLKRIK